MYFIGLDIGTTGAKALLVDKNGTVGGKGYHGYPLISDGVRIEQNTNDWVTAGCQAIHEAIGNVHLKTLKA